MIVNIGNRKVGDNQPIFIVAEMSANHLHKFDNAVQIIKAAKVAGADAIKLQTYTPETITLDADNENFQIKRGSLNYGKTLYQIYQEAYTPWEWQPKLKEIAENEGLAFFSSVFDKTAVDFMEDIHVEAYKIASAEITDIPLIEYVASKGKPVIISTGMATLCDIQEALNACKRVNNNQVILLKCVSVYPTLFEDINLRTIHTLAKTFGTIVGLSDHSLGISVPVTSVALGASVIEKHLTLSRSLGGLDAAFSLDPDEFKAMVKAVREGEKALGKAKYEMTSDAKNSRWLLRSLFIVKDTKAGEVFTAENVRSIRPGYGLHPKYLKDVIGKKAAKDLKKGTPLIWKMIIE